MSQQHGRRCNEDGREMTRRETRHKRTGSFPLILFFSIYVSPPPLFLSIFLIFPTSDTLSSFPLPSPLLALPFLPPSLPPLFLNSRTSFLCPSLPVSPVYEGKFIGLPGAVSWRWPLLLKPQQGFTLHMEQKDHSGHTGLFPSPRITHDGPLTPPIIC